MNIKYSNKKISGILSTIPNKEVSFEDEMDNYRFTRQNSLKLKKIMGYDKHRLVEDGTCISDLCVFGLDYLISRGMLVPEEIDALILVTQTPDFFIPPTSNVIQGRLGLKQNMLCLDINQGCAGYLIGLIQAFALIENPSFRKVVLLNADVLSRKVSKEDRNSYPLIGDAASITIVERQPQGSDIFATLQMDGSQGQSLIIPAGGLRMPCSEETARLEVDENNNVRTLEHLKMDGRAIFNFVMTETPAMIDNLLKFANITKDKVDYFMFHQPNKFMLQKLADKMEINYEKMPSNIVGKFGNSSGVTIPVNITYNLGHQLKENVYTICLAGFGSGLAWSSMLIKIGHLDFCETIEF